MTTRHEAMDNSSHKDLIEGFRESGLRDPAEVFNMDLYEQKRAFEKGVLRYGGGFVNSMLDTYRYGDKANRQKIRESWPEYWIKYVVFGKEKVARDHK